MEWAFFFRRGAGGETALSFFSPIPHLCLLAESIPILVVSKLCKKIECRNSYSGILRQIAPKRFSVDALSDWCNFSKIASARKSKSRGVFIFLSTASSIT